MDFEWKGHGAGVAVPGSSVPSWLSMRWEKRGAGAVPAPEPGQSGHTPPWASFWAEGANVVLCQQSHEGPGRAWGRSALQGPHGLGVLSVGNPTGAALPQSQGSKWSLGVPDTRAEAEEIPCSSSRGMLWASLGISSACLGLGSELALPELPGWDPPALVPIAFHVCSTLLSNPGANPILQIRIQPLVFLFFPFFNDYLEQNSYRKRKREY